MSRSPNDDVAAHAHTHMKSIAGRYVGSIGLAHCARRFPRCIKKRCRGPHTRPYLILVGIVTLVSLVFAGAFYNNIYCVEGRAAYAHLPYSFRAELASRDLYFFAPAVTWYSSLSWCHHELCIGLLPFHCCLKKHILGGKSRHKYGM